MTLLIFGGVIVAIFFEVAHLAGTFDLVGNFNAASGREVVKFGLKSLKSSLGEVVYLGHDHRVTPGGKPCDGRAKTCELPQDIGLPKAQSGREMYGLTP
jgi:hypothetical protein